MIIYISYDNKQEKENYLQTKIIYLIINLKITFVVKDNVQSLRTMTHDSKFSWNKLMYY